MASKHRYGELAPKREDAIEEIMGSNEAKLLVKDLADYLQKEWNNQNRLGSRKAAQKKAKSILKGEKLTHLPPKIHNTANISRDEVLKDALSKGYLEDVKIEEPWHPLSFLKGEIETFPYEHKTAILFSGISVHELFEGGGTSDHTRSAIEDGYIKPENNYKHDKRGKEVDFTVWSGNEVAGIYMGFLNTARNFARSEINPQLDALILQLEIPTNKLYAIVAPKRRRRDGDFSYIGGDMTDISSLEKMKNEFDEEGFDNPVQAFHHYSKTAASSSELSISEGIQFGVRQAVPLESVLGLWDFQYFNKPIFEPLEEVSKHLKSRYPEKMPDRVSENKIKEEVKRSRKVRESLNKIHERVEDFLIYQVKEIDEYLQDEKKWALANSLINDGYTGSSTDISFEGSIERIEETLNEKGVKVGERPKIENSRQLKQNWEDTKQLIHQLDKVVKKDYMLEKKVEQKEDWTREELKQAIKEDKRILMEIAELIEHIPSTKPWAERVIKKKAG